MKKKSLILLTKQFPYMQREQYVAHELYYLAQEFEKVYIYPHDHFRPDDRPCFTLPPNVEIWNLNASISRVPKMSILLSFLGAFLFEIFRVHDKRWFLNNARRFFSIYATQYALGLGLEEKVRSQNIRRDEVVFYSYWFSASALCLAIMKSRGAIGSFVSRAHALDLYHEDWGLLNERVRVLPFRNYKQKYVDVIYSISEHGRHYLNRKYPDIKRVEVAYLGVDDFGLNPPRISENDVFHIVTCSGVDENKRLHLLGEALSGMQQNRFRWTHFGSGPLEQRLRDSLTGQNVSFDFRGQTPNAEFRDFLSSVHTDLFVNLSRVEGLPVTLMEAASHGISLMATAVNGTVEVVIPNSNGVLLNQNPSKSEIQSALVFIMENASLENMRSASRALYLEKFCAGTNYRRFAQTLSHSHT